MSRWFVGSSISRTSGLPSRTLGHRDAHLPAARQRADVAVDLPVLEAEAVEDLARARLELVAAALLVLVLDVAEAREDRLHLVGARRVGQRVLEVDQLVVEVAEPAAPGDRLVEDGTPAMRRRPGGSSRP